jgi:L-ascorbate metabolism protein UlaG (beta-lactamase superfamily)
LDITWLGHGCFRLRGRSATVVTDPYPPSLGLKLPRLEADLVTVSHHHDNHSHLAAVSRAGYTVDRPGEYEVAGVGVVGVPTWHDALRGQERGPNVTFVIEIDEVRVCHLGDLGHKLDDGQAEGIGLIDVLLVPVGGRTTISASEAAELARALEPRIVVPMHFALPGLKMPLDGVDTFLREMGVAEAAAQPRLSLQSSGGGEGETRVVLLEARS